MHSSTPPMAANGSCLMPRAAGSITSLRNLPSRGRTWGRVVDVVLATDEAPLALVRDLEIAAGAVHFDVVRARHEPSLEEDHVIVDGSRLDAPLVEEERRLGAVRIDLDRDLGPRATSEAPAGDVDERLVRPAGAVPVECVFLRLAVARHQAFVVDA